jgi:hypothetical protein
VGQDRPVRGAWREMQPGLKPYVTSLEIIRERRDTRAEYVAWLTGKGREGYPRR